MVFLLFYWSILYHLFLFALSLFAFIFLTFKEACIILRPFPYENLMLQSSLVQFQLQPTAFEKLYFLLMQCKTRSNLFCDFIELWIYNFQKF